MMTSEEGFVGVDIDALCEHLQPERKEAFNAAEVKAGERRHVKVKGAMTLHNVCKAHALPMGLWGAYRNWLLHEDKEGWKFVEADLPNTRGKCLREGLQLPCPDGESWRQL